MSTLWILFRAYVASQELIDVDPVVEHEERKLLSEYKSKYSSFMDNDPLLFKKDSWIGEKDGMCRWPSLYYTDMSRYMSVLAPEFIFQLETEYKLGKAYRYFACELVREIFIQDVDAEKCIVKCKVVPSHRMNSKPYDIWGIIEKDKQEKPGGKIHATYCTCTAGLLGTCNHVFAMLFRIESAITTGVAKQSSTSLLCQWNVPSGNREISKPTTATVDIPFVKSSYTTPSEKLKKQKETAQIFKTYNSSLLIKQQQLIAPSIK